MTYGLDWRCPTGYAYSNDFLNQNRYQKRHSVLIHVAIVRQKRMLSLSRLPPLTSAIVETRGGTSSCAMGAQATHERHESTEKGPRLQYLLPDERYCDEAVLSCWVFNMPAKNTALIRNNIVVCVPSPSPTRARAVLFESSG